MKELSMSSEANVSAGDMAMEPAREEPSVAFHEKYIEENSFDSVRGGFGLVMPVIRQDDPSGTRFAAKQIDTPSPVFGARQLQEIRVLQSTLHPFLVKYYEYFLECAEHGNTMKLYIIMEWCSLGSLRNVMVKHKRKPSMHYPKFRSKISTWFAQICSGISVLHNRGIVHRDMKPENILLTSEEVVKICDYGLVKVLDINESVTKTLAGTLCYMSPQLIEYRRKQRSSYPPRESDIWSLGCILHEMITLTITFMGSKDDRIEENILNGRYSPLQGCDDVGPGVEDLVSKMLRLNERERPTIDEILEHEFLRQPLEELRQTYPLLAIPEVPINMEIFQPVFPTLSSTEDTNLPLALQLNPLVPSHDGSYPLVDMSLIVHDNRWVYQRWKDMVLGQFDQTMNLPLPPVQLPMNDSFQGTVLYIEIRRRFSQRMQRSSMDLEVAAKCLSVSNSSISVDDMNLQFECVIIIMAAMRDESPVAPHAEYHLKRCGNVVVISGNELRQWFRFDPVEWDNLDEMRPPKIYLAFHPLRV